MSFKKNKYSILKGAISKELADFTYAYFLNKRRLSIGEYGMMIKYLTLILIMQI